MEIQRSLFPTVLYTTLFASCLLFLLACEDPSSVGLGLVGDDSGQPITRPLNLTSFEAAPQSGVVGNFTQFLAGQVNDPTLGSTFAVGYVDVGSNLVTTTAYRAGPVERVILRLEPSYMYGDTLQELTFAVHEALNEFSGILPSADSIPDVGPELFQFSMLPTDSLLILDMPASWVESRDADLRTETFPTIFHGLQLVPIAGNAVVGFHNAATRLTGLRSIVGTDTLTFVANKSISKFSKTGDVNVQPERVAFQNGVGPKISLSFNIDSLKNVSLNRAAVRIPFDASALETPVNFFRPAVENLSLHGVTSDSSSVLLAISQSNEEGFYDFTSEAFHANLQQFFLGTTPFESYEIRFADTPSNSIDALVLHGMTSEIATPRIFLTYIALE